MEITISQNGNQLITINNENVQDISINQNDNQLLTIESPTTPEIDISQRENQTIYIDGGGAVIGITDVLVNGITVVSGNIAYVTVPTKTSELENNSGFITNETDPTVPTVVKQITLADINNWNSKQNQLISGSTIKTVNNESLLGSGNINIDGTIYTAGDGISIENNIITNEITSYNDLTDLPDIPTKTSDLLNDSDYVSENDLSEVAFTGSYNSLSDTPIIPDSTSELINDSDFITGSEVSSEIQTAIATKQDTLVSGTNIKTINNNSLLGSGDLVISGGSATDVQINGTSITSNDVANIITESTYNETTNKIATKNDIPTQTSQLTNNSNFAVTNANNYFSTNQDITGILLKNSTSNYIKSRDNSVIRQTNGSNDTGFHPLTSVKTNNGEWTSGGLSGSNNYYLIYTTDSDYSGNINNEEIVEITPNKISNLICKDYYIMATLSSNQTISTEYALLNLNTTASSYGNKFTISNNKIVIGSGVSKIRISGMLFCENVGSWLNYLWVLVRKNNSTISNFIQSGNKNYQSIPLTPTIIDVVSGDQIDININNSNYSTGSVTVRSGYSNTWLLIEVVG